ncbi:MAG TPA: 1-acyl-sn-glycerol-3-phosphate acyltransferase [Thermoanaerobaculia bacterium]|nr:1-acyl-sn-glycerol-3-phosphate acyltransferase [Thermoanaerobaculia bacterium]
MRDRIVRGIARLVLKLFFREVEVVGAERILPGRPLVLVANHVNGLIDSLLVMGPLPVVPRFLAKSTLWNVAPARPFLDLAGAIPVHRPEDKGSDPSRNAETFARSHELLAGGGALALFPEGTSHSDPSLKPLKTGAARIVLEAGQKYPGLGVLIVPVGLLFDAKQIFRSRALVQVGEPIDPAPEAELAARDPVAAVKALTARIDSGLQDVTLNYDTWEDARLAARAADLYRRQHPEVPGKGRLSESVAVRRTFLEGYREVRERHPEKTAAVVAAVRDYDALLHAFHLRDDQVGAAYRLPPVVRFVVRSLLRMLIHLPVAIVGTILTWPVYRLVGAIMKRATIVQDQVATSKVMGALLLFPLAWIAEGALLGHYLPGNLPGSLGTWAGVVLVVTAPFTAYGALLFHDQRTLFWREARAYLFLRTRRRLVAELKEKREAILRQVEDLARLRAAGAAPQ